MQKMKQLDFVCKDLSLLPSVSFQHIVLLSNVIKEQPWVSLL